MPIQIDEKYRIESDKYCWILQEKKTKNPKHHLSKSESPNERWMDVGYYADLHQLISALLDRELKQGDINTLTDIKKELLQIENRLKSRIDELISQVNAN